jgi:hypothetical protein
VYLLPLLPLIPLLNHQVPLLNQKTIQCLNPKMSEEEKVEKVEERIEKVEKVQERGLNNIYENYLKNGKYKRRYIA